MWRDKNKGAKTKEETQKTVGNGGLMHAMYFFGRWGSYVWFIPLG